MEPREQVLRPPAARIGGVILAGGRSSRMGRPKAWLPVGSSTMLDVVTRSVRDGLLSVSGGVEPPLVVVGAPGQELPPLAFPVRTVRDEVEGEGPLRGMAAGLAALTGLADAAFVSSCDAPRLAPGFVSLMARLLGDTEITVPVAGGRHHPLAAVYRVSLLPAIRELLAAGRLRPFFLFERAVTREVDEPALREVDPDLLSLHNVNTPAEYAALVETPPWVTIEMYGVARLRAGRERIDVEGRTVGEALASLASRCPSVVGTVLEEGRLSPHFRLSVNGRNFTSDPTLPLTAGDCLIVISAAVGG